MKNVYLYTFSLLGKYLNYLKHFLSFKTTCNIWSFIMLLVSGASSEIMELVSIQSFILSIPFSYLVLRPHILNKNICPYIKIKKCNYNEINGTITGIKTVQDPLWRLKLFSHDTHMKGFAFHLEIRIFWDWSQTRDLGLKQIFCTREKAAFPRKTIQDFNNNTKNIS